MPEATPPPVIRLFVDSHAHLDMLGFDADRDEVISRAVQSGVSAIVSMGTDLASSLKACDMAQSYSSVLAAVGIHPQEAGGATETDIYRLSGLARKEKVVAIGEIGLDFYRDYAPREQQVRVLKWQLSLADEAQLPVVIHCRQAESETLNILKDWTAKHPAHAKAPGVIHCFNGSLELAETYMELGFYISLGAYIGYPSSRAFREVIKHLPMDRLMLETDCPFLPPQNRRGQRNEPSYVVETAKELANIRSLSLDEVASSTSTNASRLFRLDSAFSCQSPAFSL